MRDLNFGFRRYQLSYKNFDNFTIFSQQILSDGLLLIVMGEHKSNLNCRFKLKPITT